MTSSDDPTPSRPLARPSLPAASSPAGTLPPGSAPAVGWQGPVGPRLPDRRGGRRKTAAPTLAETTLLPGDTGPIPRPARRQPMLLQGVGPFAVSLALAGAALLGTPALALGVLAVQVFLVLAILALVNAPGSGGAFRVALGAVVAADVLVVVHDGDIRSLAGVTGLALVGSLLHQLARKERARVTESIADTLVVVVLGVATTGLVALRGLENGEETVVIALLAAGASVMAARIGDRLASRPMLAVGSTRGWPGLLLGLGTGVAVAVLVAGDEGVAVGRQAALLGLVCAAAVAAADLAVDLGAAELRAGRRDARRVEALKPANLLLPFALLGPIALVAGQLVLP